MVRVRHHCQNLSFPLLSPTRPCSPGQLGVDRAQWNFSLGTHPSAAKSFENERIRKGSLDIDLGRVAGPEDPSDGDISANLPRLTGALTSASGGSVRNTR